MTKRTTFSVGIVVAVLLSVLAPMGQGVRAAQPSFFNSTESMSTNLQPFTKWTGALQRYSKESALARSGNCQSQELNVCHYNKLEQMVQALKDKDEFTQLKVVNEQLNKAKYIPDQQNWGEKDYWETPAEFMSRFGDCEDYAIAKYITLRMMGWPDDKLRVVAVKDLNLKVGHAILVAFIGEKVFVLDNQIQQVLDATRIRHYLPVFSINQNAWWRHAAG
ncbi:MAG: transglutaminase-like cysteine peptidase [Rhodospirillales bacterium]